MDKQTRDKLTSKYRAAVQNDWAFLYAGEARLPLERVFFMLQARQRPEPRPLAPPSPELDVSPSRAEAAGIPPSEISPSESMSPPIPLGQALREAPHLVLLGEPGSGKSTALQFIGLCFARADQGWHQERLGSETPLVPVLLRLPVVELSRERPVREALEGEVRSKLQCSIEEARALVEGWSREGRLLALLDGLDEVQEAKQEETRQAIEDFISSGFGRAVVASRLAGFRPLKGAREYLLKPLEDPEAEALPYVRSWLKALKREWEDQAEARARDLIKTMRAHPALRRLMNNPLLLRLSVEYYARTGGQIAFHRAALYQAWVEEAWERAARRGADPAKREEALRALEAIAWGIQMREGNDEEALRRALKEFGGITDPTAARDMLGLLREKMGLIARFSEEAAGSIRHRYVFAHQTVREYFVAQRLKRAWERDRDRAFDFLAPRLHLPEWREPLALLAALLSEGEAVDLFERIRWSSCGDEPLLLIRGAELAAELGRRIPGVVSCLLPGLRDLLAHPNPAMRQAAVEALGKLRDPQALPALIQALKDENADVRWAAARALGKFKDPQALFALTQALKDENAGVRRAAARALGTLKDPQALPALIQALKDENADVRRVAAEALGELEDIRALPALIQALKDENADVRWAAARALEELLRAPIPTDPRTQETWRRVLRRVKPALFRIGNPDMLRILAIWEGHLRIAGSRWRDPEQPPPSFLRIARALRITVWLIAATSATMLLLVGSDLVEGLIQNEWSWNGAIRVLGVALLTALGLLLNRWADALRTGTIRIPTLRVRHHLRRWLRCGRIFLPNCFLFSPSLDKPSPIEKHLVELTYRLKLVLLVWGISVTASWTLFPWILPILHRLYSASSQDPLGAALAASRGAVALTIGGGFALLAAIYHVLAFSWPGLLLYERWLAIRSIIMGMALAYIIAPGITAGIRYLMSGYLQALPPGWALYGLHRIATLPAFLFLTIQHTRLVNRVIKEMQGASQKKHVPQMLRFLVYAIEGTFWVSIWLLPLWVQSILMACLISLMIIGSSRIGGSRILQVLRDQI